MKVRVLYPTAVDQYGKKPPQAGDVIELEKAAAEALIASGSVEAENAKPAKPEVPEHLRGIVEQATAAPGEKRPARKKKSG